MESESSAGKLPDNPAIYMAGAWFGKRASGMEVVGGGL